MRVDKKQEELLRTTGNCGEPFFAHIQKESSI